MLLLLPCHHPFSKISPLKPTATAIALRLDHDRIPGISSRRVWFVWSTSHLRRPSSNYPSLSGSHPHLVVVKWTWTRCSVVPLFCRIQCWPPSVVRRISPDWPTIVPGISASLKWTSRKEIGGSAHLRNPCFSPSSITRIVNCFQYQQA